nr:MAG TPA: hypothetical protein [Caudoviricetes sp.]
MSPIRLLINLIFLLKTQLLIIQKSKIFIISLNLYVRGIRFIK